MGPYWLTPGVLSKQAKTISTMMPTPVNVMRNHQPERPVSCSRRQRTARLGTTVASEQRVPIIVGALDAAEIISSMIPITPTTSCQYQYSLRRARPLKPVYCDRTERTACCGFMRCSLADTESPARVYSAVSGSPSDSRHRAHRPGGQSTPAAQLHGP